MKELLFINTVKSTLTNSSYIGDDTAYIEEKDMIVTQDTLIEDVHFRTNTISPYDLGIKSIAVNFSDIASSGGIAKFVSISVSVPNHIENDYIKSFYEGVNQICKKNNAIVIGGDFTRASKITISVTAIGYMNNKKPATRSNAKVNDYIVTTGYHGKSRAGLYLLENNINNFENLKKSHTNPCPKLFEGKLLVDSSSSTPAMMDSSDGLADALWKIANDSNVNIDVDYSLIQKDNELVEVAKLAKADVFDWIFFGGEDYELVASVSCDTYDKIKDNFTIIGKVTKTSKKPEVTIKKDNGVFIIDKNTINQKSFDHYKNKDN